MDIICENHCIAPNMVVFETEKEALRTIIEALEKLNALKHELQNMRMNAYKCLYNDYATGYILAISTIEKFLAEE